MCMSCSDLYVILSNVRDVVMCMPCSDMYMMCSCVCEAIMCMSCHVYTIWSCVCDKCETGFRGVVEILAVLS